MNERVLVVAPMVMAVQVRKFPQPPTLRSHPNSHIPYPNPDAHRHGPRNVHDDSRFTVSDLVVQPPTHIPLCPPANNNRQPSYSKCDSNRSESSKDSVPPSQQPDRQQSPFKQEVVHSTIPTALHKPLDHSIDDDGKYRHKREFPMEIYWRGSGKDVVLIRAGDDNWKGDNPWKKSKPPPHSNRAFCSHCVLCCLTLGPTISGSHG